MRVLVGLSGGVDSMCAALKLIRDGEYVEGAVLRMHEYTEIDAARSVAEALGIPLNVIDCRDDFDRIIKTDFVEEYSQARTPNPCIICNERVKFARLADFACEHGFDKIATGHYARVTENNGRLTLSVAADGGKDQTYMLYRLPQRVLRMLTLPLSDMSKNEVRDMLRDGGYDMSDKPDSQEICFLPDGGYAEYVESVKGVFPEGDFVDREGNPLGRHKGIIRYTVGQRKGLGISLGERAFVTAIDPLNNTVTLSKEMSGKRDITITSVSYMGIAEPTAPYTLRALVKVRYTANPTAAEAQIYPDGHADVRFETPVKAAPGQSAVAYDEDGKVLFGGFIS